MRFALLGDHGDGLAMARALVDSGRHELGSYSGPATGAEYLRRWDLTSARLADPEEVLADPSVGAVIVAVSLANRPALLRRALQSERHVLCVHPPDDRPDTAYEAAMIQDETRRLLFPLLPETLHPALGRLRELVAQCNLGTPTAATSPASGHLEHAITAAALRPARSSANVSMPLGDADVSPIRMLEVERWATDSVLIGDGTPGRKPAIPGWDVLRLLGGEIIEVMGLTSAEELDPEQPLLLTGRFEHGGLLRVSLLPKQAQERWHLVLATASGRAELTFSDGFPGPARLSYADASGASRIESLEAWNPWPALVEAFEAALAPAAYNPARVASPRIPTDNADNNIAHAITVSPRHPLIPSPSRPVRPTWQDAVRCLELDDAARRSVERRRASTLEYQQATEEASFKGTMTLVGCGLLWVSLLLLILSAWVPWLGWVIVPVFGVFLVLQVLRWVVPTEPRLDARRSAAASAPASIPESGAEADASSL